MGDFIYNYGDILWCIRENFNNIEDDNHKTGPYIFIKADKDFFYALKGTGYFNKESLAKERHDLILTSKDSVLRKKTSFSTNRIMKIPYSNIINYLGKVNEEHLSYLTKKLNNAVNNSFIDKLEISSVDNDFEYCVGDVLKKGNNKYYVLKVLDKNKCILMPYLIDGIKISYLDFNQAFIAQVDDEYKISHSFDESRINSIIYNYFKYKNESKTDKLQIVSIIFNNDKLYYISTIEANNCLCYELFINGSNQKLPINLNNEDFYLDFNQKIISKKDAEMNLIFNADENKIDEIRELKKQHKIRRHHKFVTREEKDKKIKKLNIFYGRVLYYKNGHITRYCLYKLVNPKDGLFLNLDLLQNGHFNLELLSFDQLVELEDSRKEFVDIIKSLNVEIKDTRYPEFLFLNGMFNIKQCQKGPTRQRKNKKKNNNI